MKKIGFLLFSVFIISCKTINQSSLPLQEDEIFIIRKFVGTYIDYRHTGPESFSGTNLIWIKTSMEADYGKFCAYGKKCDFAAGERLYLTRTYYAPGVVSAYWVYNIENDSSVYYRLTDFQNDRKVPVQSWF